MEAKQLKRLIVLLFVLTAANACIFFFREHFQYYPYVSYHSLYSECDKSCETKWSGILKMFTKRELKEADSILISNTDVSKKTNTIEKIQTIGTFLYNKFHAQYGRPSDSTMHLKPLEKYKLLSRSPNEHLWCGNFATMFLMFSSTQNILSRVVEIYANDDRHVINECYVPELKQWILVDVTFNTLTAFSNTNKYLNAQSFRQLINSNSPVYRISSIENRNRLDRLDKNIFFVKNYFKPDFDYYYYYTIDLNGVYRSKEKLKRYFLPVSWYALYKDTEKSNGPFYYKIFFGFLWIINVLFIAILYFRTVKAKKETKKLPTEK